MTKRKRPEDALQKAVASMLRTLGWHFQHIPGEMFLHGDKVQRARQMNRMKAMGFHPGDPDVMIREDWVFVEPNKWTPSRASGHGIAIELKIGSNAPSPNQKQRMEELKDRGWLVKVCKTIDEVRDVLRHCRPRNGRQLR